jgi:hypothetical protein
MRSSHAVLALAAVMTLAACKGENKANQDVLAQDSSLTRDLQLANRDTTSQPQLKDVPTTPPPAPPRAEVTEPRRVATNPAPRATPRTTQPRHTVTPPPAAPPATQTATVTPSGNTVQAGPAATGRSEGRVGVIAAGTSLALSTGQRVCTNTNTVGDRITATLAEAVTGSNGVVIPAGATAVLEVTSLGRSEQAGENMNIGLVVRSITYEGKSYPVNGQITSAQTERVRGSDNNDAAKVAGGAVVGAILGRVMSGHSKTKGTVIGAATGAAAGAVIANQTAKYDACIPSGGRVAVRLDSPMSVQAVASSAGPSGI